MNAKDLYEYDRDTAVAWMCGVCGAVWKEKDWAEDHCCKCSRCGEACEAGKNGDSLNMHGKCWEAEQSDLKAKRIADAEAVTDFEGRVFVDGWGHRDGFFDSLKDAIDEIWDQARLDEVPESELPQWGHCCTEYRPSFPDAADVVDGIAQDMYEGFEDDVSGMKELNEALKSFAGANQHCISYEPDYDKKVRLTYPIETESP